jgi:hypothetical protein
MRTLILLGLLACAASSAWASPFSPPAASGDGFRPFLQSVTVGDNGELTDLAVGLTLAPVQLGELNVTAAAPVAVDTRSGAQVFKQDDSHGAPTLTTSQIVQQSVAGAARAPAGAAVGRPRSLLVRLNFGV